MTGHEAGFPAAALPLSPEFREIMSDCPQPIISIGALFLANVDRLNIEVFHS
jgi:hypothetical protein